MREFKSGDLKLQRRLQINFSFISFNVIQKLRLPRDFDCIYPFSFVENVGHSTRGKNKEVLQ